MKPRTFLFGVLTLSFLPLLTLSGYASERKPLIVVGDANFPPVEYIENGRVKGFNTEIWQELSKAMNRPVEIRLMLWKDAQQKVLNGEADALTLLGRTKQREKLYDFSEPTLTFEFCFFIRSDDVPFETIEDFERRTIGVTKGGYAREVLESHKNIKLLFIKNNLEGFQLLTSGKIDAVGTDKWVGAYTIQKHQIKGINIVEKPFAKSIAAITVKKGNLKLLNEINNGIEKLKKDKAIQTILDKWWPKEVVFLTKETIKRIIITGVTAFLIAVIVFSLLWIVLLKRQVNRKTGQLRQEIEERKQAEQERTKLQEQLHRAQRMDSLGLMAGGIAHDLNNILSGIVSYPELLLMDIPVDSPMRKPMETIKESGMRAVDVVSDLLTIARGVATAKEALNLNTIVAEYLGSAEHQKLERTRSFIDFKAELNPDLLNLNGSSTHMKNTLMNLVMNASEAIEGAGTVTISTTNRYLDEPLKGYEDVRIGEYAVLSVSDDGSGISAEDLEKIFEPFYTKKVMGRSGTGLGLAVVWNSVQDHNGYIDVKSSEKGTVFELYFPVTRDQIAEDKEDVPVAEYQGHGERILVVDDEERQREIACGMLTKLGYIAEAVSSGEEAIEYVKEHPVDLIVLDMVMPKGINGRETYEEIIKIRPGQKAIIASGYAKTKEVETAQELGAGNYIKKPYTMEKVGLAVKVELEK